MYTNYLKWIFQIHGRLEIRHIKIPAKKITNDNCTLIFLTFLLLLNIDYRQIISKLYYFFYMRVIGLRATSPACTPAAVHSQTKGHLVQQAPPRTALHATSVARNYWIGIVLRT